MATLSPYHREGCARLGRGRLNAFRLKVYEPWIGAYIAGAPAPLRIEGAAISHTLNDQVDTADFRTRGITPVAGQTVVVYQGDTSTVEAQLFGGRIIETTGLYEGKKPANVAYDLRCIDPTWLLNRRKVLAQYLNQSATAIVNDIVTRFTRGVTTRHVVVGLPSIDAITFTNENPADCFTAICQRIGASWYVDYQGDLHVFFDETENANPITDAEPRGSAELQITEDLSQVVTRVIGRGGGGTAAIDIQVGAIEMPVNEGDQQTWYSETGGLVEVPNAQVISYTTIKGRGSKGAQVGTGTVPTSAPQAGPESGTGLGTGAYKYALTFANATGEGLAGPQVTVDITNAQAGTLAQSTMRESYYSRYGQGMVTGGRYSWRIAISYEGGGWSLGPATPTYTVSDKHYEIWIGGTTIDPATGYSYYWQLMPGPPGARIHQTIIHRTTNGGATWYSEKVYNGVVSSSGWVESTTYNITDGDLDGNVPYPSGPIAIFGAAMVLNLNDISIPAGFTQKHLYRTTANGLQLKRHTTNVTVNNIYDTVGDASLGVNAPTTDTSGVLSDSNKNVAAGATEIEVTGTDVFAADGGAGWANIGNQTIRYTGIGAGKLTGVPATGPGALTASVRYGASILVQPRLVGIPSSGYGAVNKAILKGESVIIRLERQDDAAATAMAQRFGSGDMADGLIEETISDSRYAFAELLNHILAMLKERKDPHRTVTFTSRDPSLQVGRTITINVTKPPINGTFRIQRITFSEIAITGGLALLGPLRRVEATNKLFTFTDLLRQLRGRESGVP